MYPDHSCYDDISLERAGGGADLVLTERRDEAGNTLKIRRGMYCLAPADPGLGRGERMVDVCLPKRTPSVFRVIYPVMLGVSVICLFISNMIYLVLPRKTFLNTVMFHYTLMLFLAYLLLILIQTPQLWSGFINENANRSELSSLFGALNKISFLICLGSYTK